MTDVKVGIIGLGNMGSVYLDFFGGEVRGARITAVADTDAAKLSAAKLKLGGEVNCYPSGESLIDNAGVDAVIIVTPHYSHPSLAIRAFDKGLHVLTEKPSGVYEKQVEEMNSAAKRSGKLFGIMFNQRALPMHKAIKDAVSGGKIGKLKRFDWTVTNWYRTQYYYDSGAWRATWAGEGGGVLINQALHQLDLLQWFVGLPKAVRAECGFGRWHDIEVEDDVTAYLEFDGGATGTFITTTGDPVGVNRLRISGTHGIIQCEDGAVTLTEFGCDEREFCRTSSDAFSTPTNAVRELIRFDGKFDRHTDILNNFLAAVRGEEPLFACGEEGLNSVTLVNAMLLSAWENRRIELPLSSEEYYRELSKRIKTSKIKTATGGVVIDNRGSFGGI